MMLLSLEMNNYKNFYGSKNLIEFGKGKNSNVTAVMGHGGTGKTNIVNAFRWLFNDDDDKLINYKLPSTLNYRAYEGTEIGSIVSCWVKLIFMFQESKYMINRTQTFVKNYNDIDLKDTRIELSKSDKGDWYLQRDSQRKIHDMFLEEICEYFIADGESLKYSSSITHKRLLSLIGKIVKESNLNLKDIIDSISVRIADPVIASYYMRMLNSILLIESSQKYITSKTSNTDKVFLGLLLRAVLLKCLKESKLGYNSSEYSLILDSPFFYIDKAKAEILSMLIPKLADQVIIMTHVSDNELIRDEETVKYFLDNSRNEFITLIKPYN